MTSFFANRLHTISLELDGDKELSDGIHCTPVNIVDEIFDRLNKNLETIVYDTFI